MLIPMDIVFPDMALVEQDIETPRIADVPGAIRGEIVRLGVAARSSPWKGGRAVIAAYIVAPRE